MDYFINKENPTSYVALVSSVHQIELSAFVILKVAGLLQHNDRVLVLVDHDAQMPATAANRIKSPRLAFPTPVMVLEGRSTYRQIFGPAVDGDTIMNLEVLRKSLNAWLCLLEGKVGGDVAENIQRRADGLIEAVRASASQPGALTSAVIEHILTDLLGRSVDVQKYSFFVNTNLGQQASYDALVYIAMEVLKELGPASFRFRKGGYVELMLDGMDDSIRLDYAKVTESSLSLFTEEMNTHLSLSLQGRALSLVRNGLERDGGSISRLICHGPLVMAFLSRLGIPVDVPWYYESVRNDLDWNPSASFGLELISPISVASPARTAARVGGDGIRLNPSGYSLLDYKHPVVRKLAAAVARLDDNEDGSLFEDWQDLLTNYPSRRQKALKDQGGVSEYCQQRLYELRRSLKAGSPSLIQNMGRPTDDVSPTDYGRLGLQLLTLLRYIHDTRATDKIQWSSEQWAALEWSNIANTQGIDDRLVISWGSSLIRSLRLWRKSVSEDDVLGAPSETNLSLLRFLLDRVSLAQGGGAMDVLDIPQTYRQLCLELQSEIFMYYRAVLAISASLLKAHALSAWLLCGPEEFASACEDLIRRREGVPYIWLHARLWSATQWHTLRESAVS